MKTMFKSIICSLIVGVSPLLLHAQDTTVLYAIPTTVFEIKSDNDETESYITQTLKPVISQALSEHQRPIGCVLPVGVDQCQKSESYGYDSYFEYEEIRTPKDVYCMAKKECCKTSERQRNREQYCECYAKQLRKQSYNLTTINKRAFFDLKLEQDDSCSEYSDTYIESDMVYDRFFHICSPKNLGNEFCDKLAQTINKLISAEIVNQAEDKIVAIYSKFQLYESEYNTIVESKEFKTLLQPK